MYAIVHTALNDYYYGNRVGLKSPPRDSFWKSRVKVSVYNEDEDVNGSHCKDCRFAGILPRIKIYGNGNRVDEIYATTIHELAHASHWELRRNNWNDNKLSVKVKESWARGVQWAIARVRYAGYVPAYFGDYTGLVQDLVDPIDASGYDRTANYTMKEIEDVLNDTDDFEDWENNLRSRYANTTENGLTGVFNHWD